jgi:hypothetical protein
MALLVFITDSCKADAERHGQASVVRKLKESVDGSQNLTGFQFFPPTPFMKKSLGRSFRLIAYSAPVADNELILFLHVFARGSKEYDGFLMNWNKDTVSVTRQFQPYDDAQIRTICAQLTSVSPPTQPPEPSAEERGWLYEVFRKTMPEDELLVLETEVWVRKMRAPENRDFLALYHQMLEQLGTQGLQPASTNTGIVTHWEDNKRLGLVYLYRPDLHRLLLLEPVRQSEDVAAVLAEHGKHLATTREGQHDLSRIAARSYPYLMILDQDSWLAIQKDEEANLALSPEEAELLDSIHRAGVEGELGYPLFINGRAGSGKSTMLQYLAADYVDFALRQNAKPLPLYLTSSRDLLERARETVRGLLTAHHEHLLEGMLNLTDVDGLLNRCFAVFHDFLYGLLPAEAQRDFPRDRYVNYAEFRRLWSSDFARRPEARQISPDLAWHTVRSFIKGIRSSDGDELAPEEFNALPRRRRSVSEETYKRIYDIVWCSWYKRLCEQERYWDDQDLAARVLQLGLAQARDYSAVFCDEAQDFTPAELDIIFQLSVFVRRSLQPEELQRVPIVFAGDPLQTINPTGFRWDAVQADFHERFYAVLDPRRRSRIEVSYRELRFNYRSNPGIVKFCNLIQLVRAALLGAAGISPQEAWWVDVPVQTVWFALDNAQTKQQLEKRPDLVKLVNCEEGEETNFVQADPILKDLKEEAEGIYRNVLGPTRAKGLEFPAVVVYRYGESAPQDFVRLLNGEIALRDSEEQLPYEYFLNRLYVAASRAKGQLVVVDTSRALESFWRFATDTEMSDRLMEKAGGAKVWKEAITFLVPGREQAWSGERVDPREQAIEYAAQGRRKRDPYLLRQATLAYRSAGDEHEAGKCLALAAEYEGRRKEAGDKYRELGLYEDAFHCYWEGRNWTPLCELTARELALTSRLESQAADFMARATSPLQAFLAGIIDAAINADWRGDACRDATWIEVLCRVAERLSKVINDKSLPWVKLLDAFDSLASAGVPIDNAHLAAIAYAANDFRQAIELWGRAGTPESDEYRRSKAHIDLFPMNLRWLGILKEHQQVLQQWHQHHAELPDLSRVDDWVMGVVVDSALAEGNLSLATKMLELRPDKERAVKLLAAGANNGDVKVTSEVAVFTAKLLVRIREWKAAVQAAEETYFPELASHQLDQIRSVLKKSNGATDVFRAVVEELAISEELPAETVEIQNTVAEFLNRHFIVERRAARHSRSIAVEIVGSAIERAGKIVDALQFYEDLGRPTSTVGQQKFAAERLVRNLERHAEYLGSRGDERQARQRQVRAEQLRERWSMGNVKLSDYPIVRALTTATEWTRGPFKIVLSKSHGRLRIEHTERFETITLIWKDAVLLGDAKFSKLEPSADESAAWAIEGWNATIRLANRDDGVRLVARFGKEPFEVPL